MKRKKFMAVILASALLLTACSGKEKSGTKRSRRNTKGKISVETEDTTEDTTEEPTRAPTDPDPTDTPTPTGTARPTPDPNAAYTEMSMFICTYGAELSDTNEIREYLAMQTGVALTETYLVGLTADEAVSSILASGDYPDLIYCNSDIAWEDMYESQMLVPWDDYLADPAYSNLRNLYTDAQWELFRQPDGHIYWCSPTGHINGQDRSTTADFGFWIQTRVLEWAGYPLIRTLDEYFDLLESYAKANPKGENGSPIIPFTCLCESWRYFCLETPALLLDGKADDIVAIDWSDPANPVVSDYNTSDTAKRYYETLNQAYKHGLIDKDFAVQNYDEYIAKLCTGNVLGMFDAYWDFGYTTEWSFEYDDFSSKGYNYVPLGLTIDEDMDNYYHIPSSSVYNYDGVAVTTSCIDPDLAFSFMNQLLTQDLQNVRFWGLEGVDYYVDDDYLFYRDADQRMLWSDSNYLADHVCRYEYLPYYAGTSTDGINANLPKEQASEFLSTLPEDIAQCFEAYGCGSYVDMLRCAEPNWSMVPYLYEVNAAYTGDPAFAASQKMSEVKHQYLPQLVLSDDFQSTWNEYIEAFEETGYKDLIKSAEEYIKTHAMIKG